MEAFVKAQTIFSVLTRISSWEGIEDGYDEVDEYSTVEQYITPDRHVATNPEQGRLSWNIDKKQEGCEQNPSS